MNELPLPFTLYPSKGKTLLLLATTLAFVAGSMLIIAKGDPKGWLCLVLFGFGSVVFAVQLHPQSTYLTVSEEGIVFASLFRPSFVKWSQIEEFGVYSMRHGLAVNKFVGINFVRSEQPASKARALSKTLVGYDGGLPDSYGLKAEDLAALLTNYLNRGRRSDGVPGAGD